MKPKSRSLSALHAACAAALSLACAVAQAGSYDDFFTRIIRDDAKGIEALVQRGFDPNTVSEKGETGLTRRSSSIPTAQPRA